MRIQPVAAPLPGSISQHRSVITRWMRARASVGAARLALRAATVATVVASAIAILGGPTALLADNIQELVALTGAAAGLGLACRHGSGATRWFLVALALSLAGATLGMLAWDLSLPGVGNALFVLGVAIGVAAIVPAIFGGLERGLVIGVATDALILFLTGVVLVASTTGHDFADDHTGLIGLVLLVATVAACAFALIGRRIRPAWGGPWTLISGAAFIGASWWMWSGDAAAPTTVGLSDFTFSAGVLLIAFGGMTWNTRASYSPRYERLAPMLATVIPAAAILASLATAAIYHGAAVRDLVGVATAAVIVTGVARQVHLYVRESRALAAEHRQLEKFHLD